MHIGTCVKSTAKKLVVVVVDGGVPSVPPHRGPGGGLGEPAMATDEVN